MFTASEIRLESYLQDNGRGWRGWGGGRGSGRVAGLGGVELRVPLWPRDGRPAALSNCPSRHQPHQFGNTVTSTPTHSPTQPFVSRLHLEGVSSTWRDEEARRERVWVRWAAGGRRERVWRGGGEVTGNGGAGWWRGRQEARHPPRVRTRPGL